MTERKTIWLLEFLFDGGFRRPESMGSFNSSEDCGEKRWSRRAIFEGKLSEISKILKFILLSAAGKRLQIGQDGPRVPNARRFKVKLTIFLGGRLNMISSITKFIMKFVKGIFDANQSLNQETDSR